MNHPSGAPVTASDLRYVLPDGRVVFGGLSFTLGGERTGLVGANGVGKTILVRILAGHVPPSGGSVTTSGRVAYLAQERTGRAGPDASRGASPASARDVVQAKVVGDGAPTVASALGVEEVLAALARIESGSADVEDFDRVGDRWDLRDRVARQLERFGLAHVGLERPLASLSGGEATKIALAGLVMHEPDFVLLDEPTNDLDAESRTVLYGWLEDWDRGLLVVSHDRGILARVDRILALSPRGLRSYGGGYELYRAQKEAEDRAARSGLEHASKELSRVERESQEQRERQERRTARGRRARLDGGVPKVLLGARKESAESTGARLGRTADRRVGEKRERLAAARAAVEERDRIAVTVGRSGVHASLRVLEMHRVRYRHDPATSPVIDGVDCVVTGPERIAVVGPNGAGKTTFLRLALGELEPEAGSVRLGVARAAVAYLDQRADVLGSGRSVLEAFRAANPTLAPTESRHVLARYLFPGAAALAAVDHLSGGERIRAALACTVAAERPPSLLLLDEPTNHLDLESLEAVEHVLRDFDGALLVASHDESFLEAIGVARTVALARGGARG